MKSRLKRLSYSFPYQITGDDDYNMDDDYEDDDDYEGYDDGLSTKGKLWKEMFAWIKIFISDSEETFGFFW